ncbi:hypothetical protein DFQ27_004132 [Actinomortierella ambigua]|uniref:Uncharacterized protein n=1 Tax=Actinomortierella ambigua TaxID=1343610 RepID=A0A9P6QMI0_9FUNG|nr:hypothetical protein DFQ27_004132 [Actinomortierella ambigua]
MKPALDIISTAVREIQTLATSKALPELALAADEALQVSEVLYLITDFATTTIPEGDPNPYTVFASTLYQLYSITQELVDCAGSSPGCDITQRIFQEMTQLVVTEFDALKSVFQLPFIYDFMMSTFQNATSEINEILSTKNTTNLGLSAIQLDAVASILDEAHGTIGNDTINSLLTYISALQAAVFCANVGPSDDLCTANMEFFANSIQILENYIRKLLGVVPELNDFVVNPILEVFDKIRNDLLVEPTASFTNSISTLSGGLRLLLNVLAPLLPEPTKTEMSGALQDFLGLNTLPGDCIGPINNTCNGTIQFGAAFLEGGIDQLRALPVIGTNGTQFFTAAQNLIDALQSGNTDAIRTAIGLVKAPLDALLSAPATSDNALLKAIQTTIDSLSTCID